MHKLRPVLKSGGKLALALLEKVSELSGGACPPLTLAAGITLAIVDAVSRYRKNKEEWKEFADRLQDYVACVIVATSDTPASSGCSVPDERNVLFNQQLLNFSRYVPQFHKLMIELSPMANDIPL